MGFSDWQVWKDAPAFFSASFKETLDGGQAFRWQEMDHLNVALGDNCQTGSPIKGQSLPSSPAPALTYEGRWDRNVVRLQLTAGRIHWSAPTSCEDPEVIQALNNYFAVDTDFAALTDSLPWRSDRVLQAAIDAFPGLRILRQPLGETLLGFLCSSTKQIPQIKAICHAVANDLGESLPDGSAALPTWTQLAAAGEARLRTAKLGYRARYIHETALFLAEHPDYLPQTERAPTEEARIRLMQLPGVGRKIADCTLLFGMGRLEAFPVDTWVQKILTRAYGLENWKTEPLLDFARIHFGPAAGLAQQYLFAAARAGIIAQRI